MTNDDAHRRLTDIEAEARRELLPGLGVWTVYLDKMHTPSNTIERADRERRPCAVKDRTRSDNPYVSVVVDPLAVVDWARERPEFVGLRRDRVAMLDLLVRSVEFMGGHMVETFEPVNDPPGKRRRRRGRYWKLSRELRRRLIGGNYTPVLTPPAGRRPARLRTAPPRPPRATAGARMRNFDVRMVLHAWLRASTPTMLSEVAQREHRPLTLRRTGRPRGDALVDTLRNDVVLVHTDALRAYLLAQGPALGIAFVPDLDQVRAELGALVASAPGWIERAGSVRTLDAGQMRRTQDWWRVTLASLGLPDLDVNDLADEVSRFRAAQSGAGATANGQARGDLTPSGFTRDQVWELVKALDPGAPLPAGLTPHDLTLELRYQLEHNLPGDDDL